LTARPAFELFFGDLAPLADLGAFTERVRDLRKSLFADAKPPFGWPERVLAYRARYTHQTRYRQFQASCRR
jgi:hypothetical protein